MSASLPLTITGMSCGHCVATVERALAGVAGVEDAAVRVGHAELTLSPSVDPRETEAAVVKAIRDAGFDTAARVLPQAPASCCCAPAPSTAIASSR